MLWQRCGDWGGGFTTPSTPGHGLDAHHSWPLVPLPLTPPLAPPILPSSFCTVPQVGGNWIELPAGTYAVPAARQTYCQIEAHVRYDKLISHAPEGTMAVQLIDVLPATP